MREIELLSLEVFVLGIYEKHEACKLSSALLSYNRIISLYLSLWTKAYVRTMQSWCLFFICIMSYISCMLIRCSITYLGPVCFSNSELKSENSADLYVRISKMCLVAKIPQSKNNMGLYIFRRPAHILQSYRFSPNLDRNWLNFWAFGPHKKFSHEKLQSWSPLLFFSTFFSLHIAP